MMIWLTVRSARVRDVSGCNLINDDDDDDDGARASCEAALNPDGSTRQLPEVTPPTAET